jgi:hypothetical protein
MADPCRVRAAEFDQDLPQFGVGKTGTDGRAMQLVSNSQIFRRERLLAVKVFSAGNDDPRSVDAGRAFGRARYPSTPPTR